MQMMETRAAPPLTEMMIYRAVRLLHVLDRDLHLAVGAQPPDRAILAHVGELLAQARRDQVRERGHAVSTVSSEA